MRVTHNTLAFMSKLHVYGLSQRKIADMVGVSHGTVCYWMRKHPDMFPPREKRDEAWWREKLPEVDGLNNSVAARKLGCHRRTVWKWRRLINDAR